MTPVAAVRRSMFWGLGLLPLSPAAVADRRPAGADRAAPIAARRSVCRRIARSLGGLAAGVGLLIALNIPATLTRVMLVRAASDDPAVSRSGIALAAPPRPARSDAARRLEPRARRVRPGRAPPWTSSRRSRTTRSARSTTASRAGRSRPSRRRASVPGCPAGGTRTTRDWDVNQGGDQVGVIALARPVAAQLALRRIGRRARRRRLRRVDVRAARTTRPCRARRAPSWRCRPAAWCRA